MQNMVRLACGVALATVPGWSALSARPVQSPDLSALPKVAEVDNRFQSYNIEMAEVVGGKFWAPYGGPAGEVYRQRSPIDLANPRLRQLAQLLAPAYVRVSGTWATNTYLPAEGEVVSAPPAGYRQILTRDMWRGVIAFSKAVDAPIVTSFAASIGTRDAAGVWTTSQAQRLIDLTRSAGGSIAAAEYFNEPNLPSASQMPQGYSAADYIRDFGIFRSWARKEAPDMRILGPGSAGEVGLLGGAPAAVAAKFGAISSDAMMAGTKGGVDAVSYHFYGGVSQRCAAMHIPMASEAEALSETWLAGTDREYAFYSALRDKHEPGKPMWLTETAQAACGGSPWASTFRDSFRYVSQLGRMAQKGVRVVMHNTLAASDYALIDGATLTPRPNYWAAVLWARLMGPTVLAAPAARSPDLRLYAQCLRGHAGGVALAALNLGTRPQRLAVSKGAVAYVLTAARLGDRTVMINGATPDVDAAGQVTGMMPRTIGSQLVLPPQSISYVAVADAHNPACAGT